MNPLFSRYDNQDIRRLIAEYPLAWVVAPSAPIASASLLPMIGEFDPQGQLVRLVGHMARTNILAGIFEENGTAQFLFVGPQGYVSPEYSGKRNWGPTWNYAALRVEAEVRMDPALTEAALERLLQANEAGRSHPWTATELEDRYPRMLAAIIGFEAHVLSIDATFKLAQDEEADVLASLIHTHPDRALCDWMSAMNKERLP
ncbi:MAG: FMN-binding negative transcriptional regulator [Novosphingobium sp.]